MKLIGLLTEDPRAYFEMLEVLREQGLRYTSLEFFDPIPANVGVVLTTEKEAHLVQFDKVVANHDPEAAVAKARKMLNGSRKYGDLAIGIDPGSRPGVAVIGDGAVLSKTLAQNPESVRGLVWDIMEDYPSANVVVRVGHGDRTNRNRIFNALWDDGHTIEIVDESNTTSRSQTPDEDAAVEIAMTPGYRPYKKQKIEPCDGEIRNIQRISRLESNGRLTVSKELAARVATGELSMDQAIYLQLNSGDDEL